MHLIGHLTNTREQTIHTKNPIAHTHNTVCFFFNDFKNKNEKSVCLQWNRSIRFDSIDFRCSLILIAYTQHTKMKWTGSRPSTDWYWAVQVLETISHNSKHLVCAVLCFIQCGWVSDDESATKQISMCTYFVWCLVLLVLSQYYASYLCGFVAIDVVVTVNSCFVF